MSSGSIRPAEPPGSRPTVEPAPQPGARAVAGDGVVAGEGTVDPHGSTDTAPGLVEAAPRRGSSIETRRPPVPLRWQSFPAGDEPGTTLVLLLLFLAVGTAVAMATGSLGWGIAAFTVVALTTARHWTTTTYETNRDGLQIESFGRVRRIRWTTIHGWYEGRQGVWIIAPRDPLPWEWIGGVFLTWPGQREALCGTFQYYLGSQR